VVNGARAEHAFPEFIACKGHLSPDTIDVRLPDYSRRVGLSARAGEVMPRRFGGRVGCRDRGFLSADQKFRDRNPINFDPETGAGRDLHPAGLVRDGFSQNRFRIGCSDWSNSRSGAIGLRLGWLSGRVAISCNEAARPTPVPHT
jgi:hypothetical protein